MRRTARDQQEILSDRLDANPDDSQDLECLQCHHWTREMMLRSRTPGLVRSGIEETYRWQHGEGQLEICN